MTNAKISLFWRFPTFFDLHLFYPSSTSTLVEHKAGFFGKGTCWNFGYSDRVPSALVLTEVPTVQNRAKHCGIFALLTKLYLFFFIRYFKGFDLNFFIPFRLFLLLFVQQCYQIEIASFIQRNTLYAFCATFQI